MNDVLVNMLGIGKSFPGVKALKGVDFNVGLGEIVCLLGENGAGKSTLMKILTGVYRPDYGEIFFEGNPVTISDTAVARNLGISIIFQEFNLCPNLSVMENMFLGNEKKHRGIISYKQMENESLKLFDKLKMHIDPLSKVESLGVAQQQMVEIAKALTTETKLLIMDEPTSALADTEIETLFSIMRDLRSQGISIVFISHKLKEVKEISERVIVLKDGENSGEIMTADAEEDDFVSMMVGRNIEDFYTERQSRAGNESVLKVEDLSCLPRVKNISFEIHKGEILGLAGLIGAGRTETARLIMGADRKTTGEISIDGNPVRISHPSDAVDLGIAYLSEDRKNLGLVLPMTVRENTTLSIHRKIRGRLGLISAAREYEITDKYINAMQTKVTSREQEVLNLSGGNQQKVVIAKCLAVEPKVLILDEPTRGIDVGAKAEVHRIITKLADEGMSILLISSELPEILHICDRILVMHEGRLTADMERSEATEERIMKAAIA